MLEDEPAWQVFRTEVAEFLAAETQPTQQGDRIDALTLREREILALAARGMTNDEIAAELVISVRTVERHFHNLYLKLGVTGPVARTAAVAALLGGQPATT